MEVLYEAGRLDHDREQTAQRRHANLEVKMHKTPSDPVHRAVGTAVPITELQVMRAAQGIGSPSLQAAGDCLVCFDCRKSDNMRHIDPTLGTGVLLFPENQTMLGASYDRTLFKFSLLTLTMYNSTASCDFEGREHSMDADVRCFIARV